MKLITCMLLLAAAAAAETARITLDPGHAQVVVQATDRALRVADLGLREAGLTAAPLFQHADEIRIFDAAALTNTSPRARIWINAAQTNRYWFHTGGAGSAEQFPIPAGATIAVVLRASTNAITWSLPVAAPSP